MEILNTNRLLLRTINVDDFETLYKIIFKDEDVVKNTFGSQMLTKEETIEFFKENANFKDKIGLSVLVEKEQNRVIGLAGVLRCDYLGEEDYEIGFILEKNSWGKGYAKEIGLAQIQQIKQDIKAKRALALVDSVNIGSIKTIESLGLKKFSEVETSRGHRLVYTIDF